MLVLSGKVDEVLSVAEVEHMVQSDVRRMIDAERLRQQSLWGEQNHEPQFWIGILGEEYGEYCQAVNETVLSNATQPDKGGIDNMLKELSHIAAVAIGAMECLMRNREAGRNKQQQRRRDTAVGIDNKGDNMTKRQGDKRSLHLCIPELGIDQDVGFIYIAGIGWVADRNVKLGISYDILEKHGYVTGKTVPIGGETYTCRILRSTEWDDCMDYADSDDVWHWLNAYSWVCSPAYERASFSECILRGGYDARYRFSAPSSSRSTYNGFRPVLEVPGS